MYCSTQFSFSCLHDAGISVEAIEENAAQKISFISVWSGFLGVEVNDKRALAELWKRRPHTKHPAFPLSVEVMKDIIPKLKSKYFAHV